MTAFIHARKLVATGALLTSTLFFGACRQENDVLKRDLRTPSHRLSAVESCDALDDYLTEIITENYALNFRQYDSDWNVGHNPMPPAAPGDAEGGGPDDFTNTNTQESDVDEADLVKTDGNFVYVVQNGRLRIVKSWPAEDSETIATIDIRGYGHELYLQDGLLTVIYINYEPVSCVNGGCFYGYYSGANTIVDVYDVSDPAEPTLERTFTVHGQIATTRAVDGIIYLVTPSSGVLPWTISEEISKELFGSQYYTNHGYSVFEQPLTESLLADIERAVRKSVDFDALRDRLIPDIAVNEEAPQDALRCQDLYVADAPSYDLGSSLITAIDPTQDAFPQSAGILSSGWTVYGSVNAIYIARDSQNWNWNIYKRIARTDIHRIALQDGRPKYTASGSVLGFQYDRFGYSERDGFLRVATTDAPQWWWWNGGIADGDVALPPVSEPAGTIPPGVPTESDPAPKRAPEPPPVQANNLFVLEEVDGELVQVGAVRGYGKNESIYGIRYVDDMAYVVTFRRTDPLYAIDLSNPKEPTILGELKIPGFSNFLQSIGDGLLLGVGNDASEEGQVNGFHVQLFDVSDPQNPVRQSQLLFPFGNGWSSSLAQYEPRAFTWYASRKLLAIPYSSSDYDADWSLTDVFNGALIMRVTEEDGIQEVGRINHASFIEAFCETEAGRPAAAMEGIDPGADVAEPGNIAPDDPYHNYNPCSPEWAMWSVQYLRSVFIGDYLFGISTLGLTVSHIDDLSNPIIAISLR